MNDHDPVVITLRDVYDAITGLRTDVQVIKRDADLAALSAANANTRVQDHEARIRFLERWAWSIPAAMITGLLSVVTTVLIAVL